MKYLFINLAIILQLFSCSVHANVRMSNELLQLMQESHQRGLFNGNVSIIHQGKSVLQQPIGFIDSEKNEKLSMNSAFALGSITKEFNAVAIMMLYEKGLIDINAPLSTFKLGLPSWSQHIQVRHLLNYTSGLPRLDFIKIKVENDINLLLQQIKTLEFTPGEGYLYSNHNVFLQMKLIEQVTKQPYTTFVKKHFFNPLKMNDSSFNPHDKNIVTGYSNEGENDAYRPFPVASMVYSTASDMQKWLTALHAGKVISFSSLEVLFDTFNQNSNAALGQGMLLNGHVVRHRHHGSHFNFESQLYYNEEHALQVVLLTNNKNFKLNEITRAIESIIKNESYAIPKKSIYLSIRETAYRDTSKALKLYKKLKETSLSLYDFDNNNALIRVGYKLLEQKKYQSAIDIFTLSTIEFPSHGNAYDSLAEAYYLNGNYILALSNYQTSVKINPKNENGISMILKIKSLI